MIVYVLLFFVSIISRLYYFSFPIVSIVYCPISHNRECQSTCAIVYLLLFYLFIVLAYYTALNWHSIHSSTFLYTTL